MDDPKFSKTLEGAPVESKLVPSRIPCGEDSVLSEFSKTCDGSHLSLDKNGSGNNDQIDVNSVTVEIENEEETKKANLGEIAMEGFENNGNEDVVEGSEITKAFSLKCNNGANNGDGSEVEVAMEVVEDEGNGVAMAEETLEKIDDATTQVQLSDPTGKADGLSFFFEVFGSLDGIYQVEDGQFGKEDVLTEGEKMPCVGNETLTSHNCVDAIDEDLQGPDLMLNVVTDETNEMDNLGDKDVGNQKGNFVVGDLVWIKTKTDLWWPGVVVVVSDPLKATEVAGSGKNGSLLVKYFGNANSVWCFPIRLKHFVQFFDEMVQQNNSRNFYGAVERAANEIGRRVKEELTCSCYSKGSIVQASSVVAKKKIAHSFSQFEPVNFLAQIKCLAQDGSLPGKIKLIVAQNCLSAFYHSLGHCQLPVHQLRPTKAKVGDQCALKPEKEYSKSTVVLRGKNNSLEKCGGEADQRQRQSSSSTLTLELMGDKTEIRTGQVEIFAGCSATSSKISHSSPLNTRGTTNGSQVAEQSGSGSGRIRTRSGKGNGNWSRERKKSKYLSFPYIDPNKGTPTSGQNEAGDPKKAYDTGEESNDKHSLKRAPSKSSCGIDLEDVNTSSADMLSELLLTAINRSYYKESRCSASIKRFLYCFRRFAFLNHEIAVNKDSDDEDNSAQIEGIPSSNGKPKKRKRKKKDATSAGILFPCTVQGLQVSGNSVYKGRRGRKKRKLDEIPTKNGCGWFDLHGKRVKFVELLKDVRKDGSKGPGLLTTIPQQNNTVAETELLSETMSRQQEGGVYHAEPNSTIPDLKGNVGEAVSGGNYMAELNSVSRQRRLGKSTAADVPDKVAKNVEFSGAILLYFASGVPLPSIESLLTTFAGYGTLNESETRYLPDLSAQVFFVLSSDALRAFRSLQASNPFGAALAGYRFVYLSATAPPPKPTTKLQIRPPPPQPRVKVNNNNKSPAMPPRADPPDLLTIKQNLEMMKSMLEKAGNNLSPDMRAKLEMEIKGLLQKVNSTIACSSTTS